MKLEELIKVSEAKTLWLSDSTVEVEYGFACDLMSDALHLIQNNQEKTILITGLCNAQSIRTADMLDIHIIMLVRDKQLKEEDLALAKSLNMNVLSTNQTMYQTCGKLYVAGLKAVEVDV